MSGDDAGAYAAAAADADADYDDDANRLPTYFSLSQVIFCLETLPEFKHYKIFNTTANGTKVEEDEVPLNVYLAHNK